MPQLSPDAIITTQDLVLVLPVIQSLFARIARDNPELSSFTKTTIHRQHEQTRLFQYQHEDSQRFYREYQQTVETVQSYRDVMKIRVELRRRRPHHKESQPFQTVRLYRGLLDGVYYTCIYVDVREDTRVSNYIYDHVAAQCDATRVGNRPASRKIVLDPSLLQ